MYFIAEELRKIMANLGFRKIDEMVGQSQKLNMNKAIHHFKAQGLDLSSILHKPRVSDGLIERNTESQNHNLDSVIDFEILKDGKDAIFNKIPKSLSYKIKNTDRTVGTIISNEISKVHGASGLPKDTLELNFNGTAGQSFGCFAANGIKMTITGTTNDYFGKGLSGATIIAKVPEKATFISHQNIITGNVTLYGATSGEAYINGIAGERFCVRNSGAKAVVEGIGDHGCEYMTGGIAIILGEFGRNFAAGMSGGIAYIYDEKGVFDEKKFNLEMVELENLEVSDAKSVLKLIKNHYSYTNSQLAKKIIDNWSTSLNNFIKVMPTDYKKALEMMTRTKKQKTI
jgi:glutamate synthase (ferredoxin)